MAVAQQVRKEAEGIYEDYMQKYLFYHVDEGVGRQLLQLNQENAKILFDLKKTILTLEEAVFPG